MYAERHTVSVTTDASGDATVYTPVITGVVQSISYVKTNFTDGVDFTITSEATGQTIWTDTNINASETVCPRGAVHSTDGAAALRVAAGLPLLDYIVLAKDRIKFVVASGGNATTGAFIVVVG